MRLRGHPVCGSDVDRTTGTARGVLRAVNIHDRHEDLVRGSDRAERNSLKTLTDGYRDLDRTTLRTLNRVLQQAA